MQNAGLPLDILIAQEECVCAVSPICRPLGCISKLNISTQDKLNYSVMQTPGEVHDDNWHSIVGGESVHYSMNI